MISDNICFVTRNEVPITELSSDPVPDTDINWLKNEWRARRVRWADPPQNIHISGTLPSASIADTLLLTGHNLTGYHKIKVEFFSGANGEGRTTFIQDYVSLASLIPLGLWRAGLDPYGMPDPTQIPTIFVVWIPKIIQYQSWKISIYSSNADLTPNLELRMAFIGVRQQLSYNFGWGGKLQLKSPPELGQTYSGMVITRRAQKSNRRLSLDLKGMNHRDREIISRLENSLLNTSFFVSAYPNSKGFMLNQYSFLAKFANALEYSHVLAKQHTTKLELVEV